EVRRSTGGSRLNVPFQAHTVVKRKKMLVHVWLFETEELAQAGREAQQNHDPSVRTELSGRVYFGVEGLAPDDASLGQLRSVVEQIVIPPELEQRVSPEIGEDRWAELVQAVERATDAIPEPPDGSNGSEKRTEDPLEQ